MKKLLNQSISSNKKLNFKKDKFQTLIIGVSEAKTLDGDLKVINEASNGTIKKLISREEITGKIGNSVYLPAISGVNAEKSYFVGTGKKNKKISLTENGMTLKLVGINNKSNELQSIVNLLSQNGIAFTEINTVDNSLEDIFLDLVET